MRKQSILLVSATVVISTGMALAQAQTPQQYEKSGAPSGLQSTTPDKPPVVTLPEANAPAPDGSGAPASVTTDRTVNFEDRWSAQSGVSYLPPNPTVPNATAPAPETTGQAAKFEDRWSGQAGVPYLPPNAALPNATAPLPETTGQAPNVRKWGRKLRVQAINGRRPTNTKRNEIGRVPSFRTKKKATILAEMVD
jgi:hypothetical protein